MKLGIFGGTFDPPHIGHLIAAQEIHGQLGLDRLLVVPAAVPPHKRDEAVTPAEVRLEMVRAAVGEDDRFEVSGIELERGGTSYTVDTVRAIREEHPGADLFLAIGADQFREFGKWKRPGEIAAMATLVTFGRDGSVPEAEEWPAQRVEVPEVAVSSTEIRRRVARGAPIRYLVPAAVEAIIAREDLYPS